MTGSFPIGARGAGPDVVAGEHLRFALANLLIVKMSPILSRDRACMQQSGELSGGLQTGEDAQYGNIRFCLGGYSQAVPVTAVRPMR
jgi:hypothetical protein